MADANHDEEAVKRYALNYDAMPEWARVLLDRDGVPKSFAAGDIDIDVMLDLSLLVLAHEGLIKAEVVDGQPTFLLTEAGIREAKK